MNEGIPGARSHALTDDRCRPLASCSLARQNPFNYRGITEWVDWLDNRRLLEPIGNIWPAESETRYYAMLDEQKRAA